MNDEERLKKNSVFAKKVQDIMTRLMQDNIIAGYRAAGSAIFSLARKDDTLSFKIRMLTSRGTAVIPKGASKWQKVGSSVVTNDRMAGQFLLAYFDIEWEKFLERFAPKSGNVEVELRQVVETLKPELVG